uniref:HpcH/HpaI aldolase/citrate lyase family protein n=1 Tax=Methylobacterium sp. B34 TaxID=95563 RepID=UPI000348069D|nr:CoA ester lyase [Methylobacterium sp. B34]
MTATLTAQASAWRSMLFVPALNERFLAKAAERGADAIQLDLEDAIPENLKDPARRSIPAAAGRLAAQGLDVVVRINRPWRQALADMEAVVGSHVIGLTLPKVPDAGHIRAIAETLDELEAERDLPRGHTRLVAMIETCDGLLNMPSIAAAHPRLCGMTVGAEDLAVALGARPCYDTLYVPNAQAVVAARNAGIQPIGYVGTVADFADEEAFAASIAQARDLGFTGGFCIHPKQVPILNAGFAPSRADIAWARGVIAALAVAHEDGRGAATYDGAMIDRPVAERARQVLARADRLDARPNGA